MPGTPKELAPRCCGVVGMLELDEVADDAHVARRRRLQLVAPRLHRVHGVVSLRHDAVLGSGQLRWRGGCIPAAP